MRTRSHAELRRSKSGDEPSVGAPRRTCAVLMDAVSSLVPTMQSASRCSATDLRDVRAVQPHQACRVLITPRHARSTLEQDGGLNSWPTFFPVVFFEKGSHEATIDGGELFQSNPAARNPQLCF